jgi:hypothetical protein
MTSKVRALAAAMFLISFDLVLFELLLTRLFGVVLFAQFAHLALALALLGISAGAILQHLRPSLLPDEGLERRLAWLCLAQGLFTFLAVIATIELPVTLQSEAAPTVYQERSSIKESLLNPAWFVVLLCTLTVPFAIAGLCFAGVFQRRKEHIGLLYGADLIGGAIAAVAFLPLLSTLAGPDTVFIVTLGSALSAAALVWGERGLLRNVAIGGVVASLLAAGAGLGGEVLRVKYAAGYAEDQVIYSEWTALTRLSIHRDAKRGDFMLLDNTSASEIFLSEARRSEVARRDAMRSVVYHLHEPPAKVAILAASAGPEVAVAQSFGFTGIDAVDIAGEIFDIVGEKYPDSPVNPYVQGDTHRVKSDGRAAILHAEAPYDIIQMVHANLWSSAGLLANAWSPSLLETQEAFETYLDRLSPDGTISFGRGASTDAILRAAAAALKARGVTEPHRHMAYVQGNSTILLVKGRPWTVAERDRLVAALKTYPNQKLSLDPTEPLNAAGKKLMTGPVMTDDRPYLDDPSFFWKELSKSVATASGEEQKPLAAVYMSIVIQCLFTLAAGVLFIGVPLLTRERAGLAQMRHVGPGIVYIAGLGYGYLAVETVLIHDLILFVGHPTYAVTAVILSMLLSSGLGSILAGRLPEEGLDRRLRQIIGLVIGLGLLLSLVVSPLLYATALGLAPWMRVAITIVVLFPLGFVMGMPFPTALRLLRPEASALVPWGWAINGWMSVVASLTTVVLSRMWGYSVAFGVALLAYVLAFAMVGWLRRIGPSTAG